MTKFFFCCYSAENRLINVTLDNFSAALNKLLLLNQFADIILLIIVVTSIYRTHRTSVSPIIRSFCCVFVCFSYRNAITCVIIDATAVFVCRHFVVIYADGDVTTIWRFIARIIIGFIVRFVIVHINFFIWFIANCRYLYSFEIRKKWRKKKQKCINKRIDSFFFWLCLETETNVISGQSQREREREIIWKPTVGEWL